MTLASVNLPGISDLVNGTEAHEVTRVGLRCVLVDSRPLCAIESPAAKPRALAAGKC